MLITMNISSILSIYESLHKRFRMRPTHPSMISLMIYFSWSKMQRYTIPQAQKSIRSVTESRYIIILAAEYI